MFVFQDNLTVLAERFKIHPPLDFAWIKRFVLHVVDFVLKATKDSQSSLNCFFFFGVSISAGLNNFWPTQNSYLASNLVQCRVFIRPFLPKGMGERP